MTALRLRSPAHRLGAGLLTALLVLATIEGGARLYGLWQLHQRRDTRSEGDDLSVLCVGDSWTFGVGVGLQESFPARLPELLREEQQLDASVTNAGRPGAHALTVNQELEARLRERPYDVVIYLAGKNTSPERAYYHAKENGSPTAMTRASGTLARFAIYRLLRQVVARGRLSRDKLLQDTSLQEGTRHQHRSQTIVREVEIYDNLARAKAITAARGAKLLVATYGLTDGTWEDPVHLNEQIRKAAAALEVNLADVEAEFRYQGHRGSELWLYPDAVARRDFHLNGRGYRFVASTLARGVAATWGVTPRDPFGGAEPAFITVYDTPE